MLELSDDLLVGTGRDRACYQHPQNPDLCIKVALRPEKQTYREMVYFSLLTRKGKDMSHLALFRGLTATNLGKGAMFDLVRDSNGEISPTLRQAIASGRISTQALMPLVNELRDYLYRELICIRDLSPNNLMLQTSASGQRLIVIDGVSNPGVNPLNIRWSFLSRHFLDKSWRSFSRKLKALTV